jgi:hypothetical protein
LIGSGVVFNARFFDPWREIPISPRTRQNYGYRLDPLDRQRFGIGATVYHPGFYLLALAGSLYFIIDDRFYRVGLTLEANPNREKERASPPTYQSQSDAKD